MRYTKSKKKRHIKKREKNHWRQWFFDMAGSEGPELERFLDAILSEVSYDDE